jgi:hypothetical protein
VSFFATPYSTRTKCVSHSGATDEVYGYGASGILDDLFSGPSYDFIVALASRPGPPTKQLTRIFTHALLEKSHVVHFTRDNPHGRVLAAETRGGGRPLWGIDISEDLCKRLSCPMYQRPSTTNINAHYRKWRFMWLQCHTCGSITNEIEKPDDFDYVDKDTMKMRLWRPQLVETYIQWTWIVTPPDYQPTFLKDGKLATAEARTAAYAYWDKRFGTKLVPDVKQPSLPNHKQGKRKVKSEVQVRKAEVEKATAAQRAAMQALRDTSHSSQRSDAPIDRLRVEHASQSQRRPAHPSSDKAGPSTKKRRT